jgi:hypothetical protein
MLTFLRKTERTLTALINLMSVAVALGAVAVIYFQSIQAGLVVVPTTIAIGVLALVWLERKRQKPRTLMTPRPA